MIDLDLLKAALDEARLAPSVHNVQPTRWRLAGDRLLLLGDPVARDSRRRSGRA